MHGHERQNSRSYSNAQLMYGFDESKHPRASDGKFGQGGGAKKGKKEKKGKEDKDKPKGMTAKEIANEEKQINEKLNGIEAELKAGEADEEMVDELKGEQERLLERISELAGTSASNRVAELEEQITKAEFTSPEQAEFSQEKLMDMKVEAAQLRAAELEDKGSTVIENEDAAEFTSDHLLDEGISHKSENVEGGVRITLNRAPKKVKRQARLDTSTSSMHGHERLNSRSYTSQQLMYGFDESKIKRAPDGKFGEKGGEQKGKEKSPEKKPSGETPFQEALGRKVDEKRKRVLEDFPKNQKRQKEIKGDIVDAERKGDAEGLKKLRKEQSMLVFGEKVMKRQMRDLNIKPPK